MSSLNTTQYHTLHFGLVGKIILVFPAGGEGPHQGGPEEEGLRPKEELLGAQP